MSCGTCASIRRPVTQNCLDINPISFNLPVGPTSTTIDSVYQSVGGTVTASGILNVQGTISTNTDVILIFQQGAVTVATVTLNNVFDDSAWGFSVLTPFDNIDVTINNGDVANASTGSLEIVLLVLS